MHQSIRVKEYQVYKAAHMLRKCVSRDVGAQRGCWKVVPGGHRGTPRCFSGDFQCEVSAGQKSQRKALEFHGICVSRLVVFE